MTIRIIGQEYIWYLHGAYSESTDGLRRSVAEGLITATRLWLTLGECYLRCTSARSGDLERNMLDIDEFIGFT
jgi:hypothetical protein